MAALEELGRSHRDTGAADVAVFCLDEGLTAYYHSLAEEFRSAGLKVDVFYEKQKMGRQFKTAEKKGIPIALICGEDERANATITMKDLTARENYNQISLQEAVSAARKIVDRLGSEDD